MRKVKFSPGEYYHTLNRGNNKQSIFLDERDYVRFAFLMLHFQSVIRFYNISYSVNYFIRHRVFSKIKNEKEFLKKRQVSLLCFVLMPNHFHLLVREESEHGISNYLQRVQDGYTKYFNAKYKKSGHLFQGPFKAVHVKDNNQLLYLSSYIHKNPK